MKYIGISEQFVVMFGNEQNEYSHSHYGIQLLIPTNRMEINGRTTCEQVLIDSNVPHLVYGNGEILSLLFKPESDMGQKIKQYYFKDESIVYLSNPKISNAMNRVEETIMDMKAMKRLIIIVLGELVGNIDSIIPLDNRI